MYAEQQQASSPGNAQAEARSGEAKKEENVVDAEFTEVKDKKTG
jgi:hypothetical protein